MRKRLLDWFFNRNWTGYTVRYILLHWMDTGDWPYSKACLSGAERKPPLKDTPV